MSRARLGALAVLLGVALVPFGGAAVAQEPDEPSALVVLIPNASFEELMAISDIGALARRGGAALLVNPDDVRAFGAARVPGAVTSELDLAEVAQAGALVNLVERHRPPQPFPDDLLVIVIGDHPTAGGIVLARGASGDLFPDEGEQGSLTSGSTRRNGVVTGGDIRATLVDLLGVAPVVAGEIPPGEPIEIAEGPPPFELHERYLAQRRMYVPIGIAAGSYAAAAGLLGLAVAFGARVPARARRATGWACLSIPVLATALLAAGHLPELSYATVVPFVALVTVVGTLAFSPLEARGVRLIPAGIGVAVLAFFALEALLSWNAALTPFLGGSHLDGGRFHGLPNAYIGLLLGAALWFAHRLPTAVGVGLLVAVGLFAGLPYAGENLGGAVTMFAGAGLWLAVRERERLGAWRGAAVAAAITVLGTAAIVGAHALAPVETHVSRFAEEAGGLAGVLERYADRFEVGLDLIARSPFALIPVLGLPFALWLLLRPPAALAPSLERSAAWRDALLVILLGGVVAYLANDSGPAAAGLAFGTGLGGLLGVSLLAGAGKMGEP